MKFVIFGLTLSSAWANGHATPWRALLKGLHGHGHSAVFYEHDVDYYSQHRDLTAPEYCELVLYRDWSHVETRARRDLQAADVAIVTSYCPDGLSACQVMLDVAGPLHVFYDMDTPVTLAALEQDGLAIRSGAQYLVPELIPTFDLYLSFSGGPILECLERRWGARRAMPLYGCVDPELYVRVPNPPEDLRCVLGYLGTYAPDRDAGLQCLLIEPARNRPQLRFVVVGSMYPPGTSWPENVVHREHLPPARHADFYSANRLTLSISREAMRAWGYTPSGRLFEATACGTPVLTDPFPGVDQFFVPGEQILVADSTPEAQAALDLSDAELRRIGTAGRERTLQNHTGAARAQQLVAACELVAC